MRFCKNMVCLVYEKDRIMENLIGLFRDLLQRAAVKDHVIQGPLPEFAFSCSGKNCINRPIKSCIFNLDPILAMLTDHLAFFLRDRQVVRFDFIDFNTLQRGVSLISSMGALINNSEILEAVNFENL